MRRLAVLATGLLLSACITAQGTPTQRLYEASTLYNSALAGAVAYAQQPTADHGLVVEMNNVNQAAAPYTRYAQAYVICNGKAEGVVRGMECGTFNFTAPTVSSYAAALRSLAATLLLKQGA